MDVSRRAFLALGATAGVAAATAGDKLTDGGFAPVSRPGEPGRATPLVPAGARSFAAFDRACVGCQLCVAACPNHVLVPSSDPRRFLRPEMRFSHGYCRVDCNRCGEACPAGAIKPLALAEKINVHVGHAVWHKDRCLAATEGVECHACERHCPVQAIVRVSLDKKNPKAPLVPQVDTSRCIGCGACEHLCPARPEPAMTLKGFAVHRVVTKMGDADVLAEAKRLLSAKAAFALVKDGVIFSYAKGCGVKPLLDRLETRPEDLKGAWLIDKVVGRAAAAIAVKGGVKRVHALTLSEDAESFLREKGVQTSCDEKTPKILNRDKTGPCPMEEAVSGLSDVEKMVDAVAKKSAELAATPR